MSSRSVTPIFSFLAGAAIGALIALLYAPSSGEELRTQIREEAEETWERAATEWDKAIKSLQASLDETRQEVDNLVAQAKASLPSKGKPGEQV